jgi:hypothetical protein
MLIENKLMELAGARTIRTLCVLVSILACVLLQPTAVSCDSGGRVRESVDWILLIDTSGSMNRNVEGTTPLDRVKDSLRELTQNILEGDSVTLYTFDSEVKRVAFTRIEGQQDKDSILKVVDGVRAHGAYTQIGEAIQVAVKRAREFQTPPDPNRNTSILLFTDGIDEPRPGSVKLKDIDVGFLQAKTHMFFVWLGKREEFLNSPLENFVAEGKERGAIISTPSSEGANQLSESILSSLPPRIRIHPSSLYFGDVEAGSRSTFKTLNIESRSRLSIRVALDGMTTGGISLSDDSQHFVLNAGENSVHISLKTAADMQEGMFNAILKIIPDNQSLEGSSAKPERFASIETISESTWEDVGIRLNITRTSTAYKVMRPLLILLLLLLVSTSMYSVYRRKTPIDLFRSWRLRSGARRK